MIAAKCYRELTCVKMRAMSSQPNAPLVSLVRIYTRRPIVIVLSTMKNANNPVARSCQLIVDFSAKTKEDSFWQDATESRYEGYRGLDCECWKYLIS